MRHVALAVALTMLALVMPSPPVAAQANGALYGDIVIGDEEAFLDLQMDADTAWRLLRQDLGDSAELLPEAVLSDTWLVVDELWLRLEPLPYRTGSWVRVRVRVGDMLGGDQRQRAESLLVRVALALDALHGASAPQAASHQASPAPAALAPAVVSQPLLYAWVPYGVLFSADWLANSWWLGSGGQVSLSVYIEREPTYWWGWHVFDPYWNHHHDYWYFDHWYAHHNQHWDWYDGYGWGHPGDCGCCNGGDSGGSSGGGDGDGTGGGGEGTGGGGKGGGGSPLNPRIVRYDGIIDVARDVRTVTDGQTAHGGSSREGPRSVRPTRSSVGRTPTIVSRSTPSVRLAPLPRGSFTTLGTIETVGFGRSGGVSATPTRGSAPWTTSSTPSTTVARSIGSPVPSSTGSRGSSGSSRPTFSTPPGFSSPLTPSIASRSSLPTSSRGSSTSVSSSRSSPTPSSARPSSSSNRPSSSPAPSASRGSSSSGGSSSAGRSGSSSGGRSSGSSSGSGSGSRSGSSGGRRGAGGRP